METMRTGILRALTALLLAVLLVTAATGAAADRTGIENEEQLVAALQNGGEYFLTSDIQIENNVQLNVKGTTVLDMAGHSITTEKVWLFVVQNGGNLTIDNTQDQGEISAPNASALFYVFNGGELTVKNGTYRAPYIVTNKGKIVIENGNFIGNADKDPKYKFVFDLGTGSETYIYNGSISNCTGGIKIMNTPKATVPVTSNLSQTTMGNYQNKEYLLTDAEYDYPVKLVYGKEDGSGPSIRATYAGIYGNFWYSETDITINGGEIVSEEDTAIYHPQQGKFTMNGGIIEGDTGIEAKMGHFTFNGGYVIGRGDALSEDETQYDYILGGSTANGAAMKFEMGYYGARDEDGKIGARGSINQEEAAGGSHHLPRNNDFSLEITDGVFISKNNAPITVQNWNMCSQDISYSIKGGRFSYFPKTIDMKHDDSVDGTTAYGVPICNTVENVQSYLYLINYKFAPAAYYDGVDLQYGYKGIDAPYYASMADAIDDRDNDPDARAYIYYLLDNGLPQGGNVDRQLQVFYNLADYCGQWIPADVGMGTENAVFDYDFDPSAVQFNFAQYVLTDTKDSVALWSPAVTYDANGGQFEDGTKLTTVLATTASGLFEDDGYGYVVDISTGYTYETYDENGAEITPPADTVLINPENPVREGYIFKGWYEAASGGSEFDKNQQIKANKTVYAQWDKLVEPSYPQPGATEDNELDKTADERLDKDYQANVTLMMPSYAEPLETDVVFVLDKSTSAELEKQALEMLRNLQGQLEDTEAKIKVGVVIFNKEAHASGFMDLATQYDEIEKAIKQDISSGTNTHAGLLAGIKMLEEDTSVSNSRKYLIFISDGITYIFDDGQGNATSILTTAYEANAGNVVTKTSDTMDTLAMKYPYNTDFITKAGGVEAYLAQIGALMAKDGKTYWGNYGGEYTNTLKSNRNGSTKILDDNVFSQYVGNDSVDAHANNIDTALYLTYQAYQSASSKYHCYAMKATSSYSTTYPWSDTFMDCLTGGKNVSFADIQNDLCYLYGAGSEVTDVIGYGDEYNKNGASITDAYAFDFVNDSKALMLEYGVVNEDGVIEDPIGYAIDKQDTDANGNTTYYFGQGEAENGKEYAFELTYYPNGIAGVQSNQVEHFTLKFNRNIKLGEQVVLTYKVELEEEYRKKDPGLYDKLHTNKNAYIDPVDSEGNGGVRQYFPDPTTSYENVRVYKEWKGKTSNQSVQVKLNNDQGATTHDILTLNAGNNWQGDFLNIREDECFIEEINVPKDYNYTVNINDTKDSAKEYGYTVVNTYVEPVVDHPEMDLTIRKVWIGDNPANRPKEIKVRVGVNNDSQYTGLYFTLNEANGWQATDYGVWVRDYYVEELNTPAGYVSTVEREGNTFIITNTYVPATGDDSHLELWIALACLGIGGLLLMTIKRRKNA